KAKLCKANLPKAKLVHCDLTNADLRDANLSDADLTGAVIDGTNFGGANVRGARMRGLDPSRAKGLAEAQAAGSGAIGPKLTELAALAKQARGLKVEVEIELNGESINLEAATFTH